MKDKNSTQDTKRPMVGDKLVENIINLAETYLKIIQLEVRGSVASTLSILLVIIIASFTALLCIFMLSIGLSVWLSQRLEIGVYGGFFITAGGYALILLLVIASKKNIKRVIDVAIEKQIRKTEKN